jgi:hypothetical protein
MSKPRHQALANQLASVRGILVLSLCCGPWISSVRGQQHGDVLAVEPFEEASSAPSAAAAGHGPFVAASQTAIDAALARHAGEPSIEAVVRATVRATPSSQAAELASRARLAGWVPRVGVRARRGQGVDLAASQTADAEALRLSTGDDLTLEASLTFELDRVVFRSEEVALAREQRAEAIAGAARVHDVIALYFERRRLQLERDLGAPPSPARSARIAEIETLLDIFTRGEFRRMMRNPPWRTGARTSASRSQSPRRSR